MPDIGSLQPPERARGSRLCGLFDMGSGGSTHVAESKKTHGGCEVVPPWPYLTDFGETQPLVPLEPLLANTCGPLKSRTPKESDEWCALDLRTFRTVESLEALGLDRLKRALQAHGMKCGGDVKARAARLFSVRGVPVDKIDAKLKTKKRAREEPDRKYRTLLNDARVDALLDHLRPVLDATTRRAERKLTRTKDEIDAEARDEGSASCRRPRRGRDDEDPLDAPYITRRTCRRLGWPPIPTGLQVAWFRSRTKCGFVGTRRTRAGAFGQHFGRRHSHGIPPPACGFSRTSTALEDGRRRRSGNSAGTARGRGLGGARRGARG